MHTPSRVAYAALGVLLSQGSPVGALALRWWSAGVHPVDQLSDGPALYVYLSLGTLVAFGAFGWLIGRAADRLAVEQGRLQALNRRLRWLAVIDPLTGILNRRTLQRRLAAELLRAQRHGTSTALILLDLDEFKKVNDGQGHLVGDHVLRGVARRLRRAARQTDAVGRFGGEEFLIVLPDTGMERALGFAERVRRLIERRPFRWRGLEAAVTASLGVAALPAWATADPLDLIGAADRALYRAKRAGRNRVCGP